MDLRAERQGKHQAGTAKMRFAISSFSAKPGHILEQAQNYIFFPRNLYGRNSYLTSGEKKCYNAVFYS